MKTLKNIVDEKQVGIKEAKKIISSLNASQKLLESEVLKLVKLILLVILLVVSQKIERCFNVKSSTLFSYEDEDIGR